MQHHGINHQDITQHFDYTISDDFFISLEQHSKNMELINLWLHNQKYSLESNVFFKEIMSFINWTKI